MIQPHILLGNLIDNNIPDDVGTYHYGNVEEVKEVMHLTSKNTEGLYPLVWLELPFTNPTHSRANLQVNMKLFLATSSKKAWLNDRRQTETYNTVLEPLYEKLRKLLIESKSFKIIDDEFTPNWLPNFYTANLGSRETPAKNQVLAYWDVLTMEFTAKVTEKCDTRLIN